MRRSRGDCCLSVDNNARSNTMKSLDFPKQDMTFDYGERSFALRAYRDDGSWHSVIIENKTPLRNTLPPTADAAKCFAQAVAFVTAAVDGATRVVLHDAAVPELEGSRVMVGVPSPTLHGANARGGA
jgi:hypothetical protein